MRKAQKAKPPPLAWFLILDLLVNKKHGGRLRKLFGFHLLILGTNSNQRHWIRGELFLQRFLPTITGSSKQSEWQSKYPISQVPPAWDFSLRQQQHQVLRNWRALLIWTFLKGYTVSCLPTLQTHRKRDKEISRRACHKASQAGLFSRYLFNFMHGSSHICFPPFPISFIFPF